MYGIFKWRVEHYRFLQQLNWATWMMVFKLKSRIKRKCNGANIDERMVKNIKYGVNLAIRFIF